MKTGRLAQLVRASALQAGGHKFESCIVHHFKQRIIAGVAQLVRASACHAEGRAFKSRHSRHFVNPYFLIFIFKSNFLVVFFCCNICMYYIQFNIKLFVFWIKLKNFNFLKQKYCILFLFML